MNPQGVVSMSGNSTFGLVTVLFNSEKYLDAFTASLAAQTFQDFRLIVVDNRSADRSLAESKRLCAERGIPAVFVENRENLGIAAGNNQGISAARELGIEHIILLNNDIKFAADILVHVKTRVCDAGIPVWTPRFFVGDGPELWYAGGYLSFWLARGIHERGSEALAVSGQRAVSYAPTCFMYVHDRVFQQVGRMDERYFVYYDDTDFCRRLQGAGIPIAYDAAVVVNHYVGGSSGGDLSPFFLRISTRNKFFYISKFYSGPGFLLVFSLALVSKLVQIAMFRGRARDTWLGLRDYMRHVRS